MSGWFSSHLGNAGNQRQQLFHVRHVGDSDTYGQRDALAIDQQMMLGAGPRAVEFSPVTSSPADRVNTAEIQGRTRPVDFVGTVQFRKQDRQQFLSHAGSLPIAQSSPTCHPATTVQLLRQEFPGNAGSEYAQDARQRGSVIKGRAPPTGPRRMMLRKNRFDP